jgi:hypothetical protein
MQSLIRVCSAPSAFALNVLFPSTTPLRRTAVQNPTHQTRQADIKVDTINVDLSLDENSACKVVERPGRQTFPAGGECNRRVPQTFLQRRIAFAVRDRVYEFDGIGQESAQAVDDEGFEIGSRDPLTLGTVQRGAGDEAAGDVVAIPRSFLDCMSRRHGFGIGVEDDTSEQAWLEGLVAFPPLHPILLQMPLHSSP